MNTTDTPTAETYYVTQVRRPGSENWAKLHVEQTALAAAMALTDALTTHGMHHSDIHGLREDLVAGHVLTADDGYAFRIQLRQSVPEPEPERDAEQALRATTDEGLLSSVLGLTHRIHSMEQQRGRTAAEVEHAATLRTQRDMVRAEILRRMGGTR